MAKKCISDKMIKNKKLLKYNLLIFIAFSILSCAKSQGHLTNEKWLEDEKAAASSTVLLNNESGIIPFVNIENLKIASINFGFNEFGTFDSLLNKYQHADPINGGKFLLDGELNKLSDNLKFYNTLVLQLTDAALTDKKIVPFILEAEKNHTVILTYFGSGQLLASLESIDSPLLWCAKTNSAAADIAAQALFGGTAINNKLSQNYSRKYKSGSGFSTQKIRLKYSIPEEVGINTDDLQKINDIAAEAIRQKATPSAVVMVIKDGNVIFNKAYGSPTYANARPTRIDDIYDLASVTKVSATTPTVMHLVENGKLNLDSTLSAYLARTRNTDKQDIKVREVMLHQAGFIPYIPFFQKLTPNDYRRDSSAEFPTKVADNYYLRKNYYEDVMWPQMLKGKILTRGQYVYSDLSMYYMQEVIESITHIPLEDYVYTEFYKPLGMQTAGFLPRNRFEKDRIIPTEDDLTFRKTLLQGYVHDQGAAMAGGVAGHAGLFANANDLGILYQMLLNRGTYGGKQYFKPETVDMFTAKQSAVSRRGLGFDRWDPETSKHYPSEFASPKTFGHTGYTGTCVWVDPEYNLVYIFLSNRVNPQVTDTLSHLSIRPRIQDVIYEAIKKAGNK